MARKKDKNLKPSFFFAHKFNKTIEIVATKEFSHIQFSQRSLRDRKRPSCKKRNLGKSTINRGKGVISFHSTAIKLN